MRLREGIRRRLPDKWKNNNWFLHYENAPAHTSLVVRQFLTYKNITLIPHSPIRLTSRPATFSFSSRWNYSWNGVVLTRLKRSTQNRKKLSTHSHLRTSRDAWNRGKHAGVAVYIPRELLRRRRWKLGVTVRTFLWSNSPNFWVAPRIYCLS